MQVKRVEDRQKGKLSKIDGKERETGFMDEYRNKTVEEKDGDTNEKGY